MAFVALGGLYDTTTEQFTAHRIGFVRNLLLLEDEIRSVQVDLDIPLDGGVTLDVGSGGVNQPSAAANVYLDLGWEGHVPLGRATGPSPLSVAVPAVNDALSDASIEAVASVWSNSSTDYGSSDVAVHDLPSQQTASIAPLGLVAITSPSMAISGPVQDSGISFSYTEEGNPDRWIVELSDNQRHVYWKLLLPGDSRSVELPAFSEFDAVPERYRPVPYPSTDPTLHVSGVELSQSLAEGIDLVPYDFFAMDFNRVTSDRFDTTF